MLTSSSIPTAATLLTLTTLALILLCTTPVAGRVSVEISASESIPSAHVIQGVPYHRQVTEYACGAASFQMAMGYRGIDLNQYSIIDVLRTSIFMGTYSMDIVRGGQFSYLSNATGNQYPSDAPLGGWDHNRNPGMKGLAAFGYRQMLCWLDDLKPIIAQDIPAVVLMEYGDVPFDGHYRVLIGYNDTSRQAILLDPWDRDGQPRVISYSYEVFCGLWAYPELLGNVTNDPNFAAIMLPWEVKISYQQRSQTEGTVTALVGYACPYPFCKPGQQPPFIAQKSAARVVALPSGMSLASGANPVISFGDLVPGNYQRINWSVQTPGGMPRQGTITVDAWGTVSGSLPAVPAYNSSSEHYPAYTYRDVIGGSGTFTFH